MGYTEAHKHMFVSSRHEINSGINFNIPWDSNAFKGFLGGTATVVLVVFLLGIIEYEPGPTRVIEINRVPLELLSFGSGDGTGVKSGNLQEEGAKAKGEKPQTDLHDAEIASKDVVRSKTNTNVSDEVSDKIVAVKEVTSNKKTEDNANSGNSSQSVGAEDGSILGSGLKSSGRGSGAGDGFGDIDWGGGGNRIVLKKVLPTMPQGVQASARIVLRFKVLPNGTVSSVTPTTKADPALEKAAIDALKKWQFNPLESNTIMEGVIPLTFILR